MNYQTKLPLTTWAEEDQPREKLLHKGKQSLTDAELLAIILSTGNRDETAVGLSKRILRSVDHNLHELGRTEVLELMKFKGIGEAKAISIVATLELGRRRQLSDVKERPKVSASQDAYRLLSPLVQDLKHEEFWILLLNRSNRVVAREQISSGGVSGTVVDAKVIFKKALDVLASSIILCHNHPSGNLKPSRSDLEITQKLKRAGENLEVTVLDHLIISELGFYSFADEGTL